jgi:hypothetical protein
MARRLDVIRRPAMASQIGTDILRAICAVALSLGLIRILGLG